MTPEERAALVGRLRNPDHDGLYQTMRLAADLVEQDGRKLEEAVAAEREACAKAADDFAAFVAIGPPIKYVAARTMASDGAKDIADVIRSRSSLSKDKRAG